MQHEPNFLLCVMMHLQDDPKELCHRFLYFQSERLFYGIQHMRCRDRNSKKINCVNHDDVDI